MAAAASIFAGPDAGIPPESLFTEFTVKLPSFEGPLDLLLHLIKKHEVDIFDIPIAFITSEYLTHLRALEELDVTLSSEFLVMAATLVHIKSQMLLPSQYLRPELTDHEYRRSLSPDDPRYELVQALLTKQALSVVAEELEIRDQWARAIYYPEFEREWEGAEGQPIYDLSSLSVNKLLTAFQRALTREKPATMTVITPKLSVADVMREIRHLHRSGQLLFTFGALVETEPAPFRVVAVFLALLELARQGKVRLFQRDFNGEIEAEWEEAPAGA